jgi:hypothetical protein
MIISYSFFIENNGLTCFVPEVIFDFNGDLNVCKQFLAIDKYKFITTTPNKDDNENYENIEHNSVNLTIKTELRKKRELFIKKIKCFGNIIDKAHFTMYLNCLEMIYDLMLINRANKIATSITGNSANNNLNNNNNENVQLYNKTYMSPLENDRYPDIRIEIYNITKNISQDIGDDERPQVDPRLENIEHYGVEEDPIMETFEHYVVEDVDPIVEIRNVSYIAETQTCSSQVVENYYQQHEFENFKDLYEINETDEWESTEFFEDQWLKYIKDYQDDLISTETVIRKDVKFWFEYVFNQESPVNSTFRCRICYRHAGGMYKNKNQIPKISTENGTLSSSKDYNGKLLRKHANDDIHNIIIKRLRKTRTKTLIEQIKLQNEEQTPSFLLVTSRMMLTVYAEIRIDLPFNRHSFIVELLRLNNVNMGLHHDNRNGMQRMSSCISRVMQKDLLNELVNMSRPVSIMINGSVDISHNHLMICYIVFVRNNQPVTVFYRLIKIGVSENAASLFSHIINAFKEDGLEEYLKLNLIAFISDSAAVLSSEGNSVSARF